MFGSVVANSTSTTGPMTCTIFPSFAIVYSFWSAVELECWSIGISSFPLLHNSTVPLLVLSQCHLCGGDFQQFLRDTRLANLVIFQRQILDHLLRVVRRVLHGDHARTVLARF